MYVLVVDVVLVVRVIMLVMVIVLVLLRIVLIFLITRVVFGVVGGRVVPLIRVVVVVCVALYESYALLVGLMDFGFCD